MQQKQRQSTWSSGWILDRRGRPTHGQSVDQDWKRHRHVETSPHLGVAGTRRRRDRITATRLLVGACRRRVVERELDVIRQLADMTSNQNNDEQQEQLMSYLDATSYAAHEKKAT